LRVLVFAENHLKILQTNFHRGWGGEASSVLTLALGLQRRGHEVMLAAPADGELFLRAVEAGLPAFGGVVYRRGFGWHNFRDLWAVRRLAKAQRFDVIHAHGSMDAWITSLAVLGLRPRPLLIRTRHNLKAIKPHFLNRWYFRSLVDHVVAISASIRDAMVAAGFVTLERVTVIPSPPDLAPFLAGADGGAFRRELGIPAGAQVVTTVARLQPEKGVDILVRAFAELAPSHPNARLVICGSGREVKLQVRAMIAELGLEGQARMAGFRRDVPAVLAATDVYALPSRAEGLGFSLLEAMASGCPVVASRVGGVPEIVTDGQDGLLVEPENPAALASAIGRLLDSPELRARLGAAGRATAQERFATERLVGRVEELYQGLVKRKT